MMRGVLAAIPLLALPVAAYALLALTLGGGLESNDVHARLTGMLAWAPAAGGGRWPVSAADLLLAAALVVTFLDLLRGVEDRRVAIANHALSIALFVICLVAMALSPAFDTATFALISLMTLLDLIAGFVVTMGPAREAGGASPPRKPK